MNDHLPTVYTDFRRRFPDVVTAHDAVAAAVDAGGPLDAKTQRLVKLGIAASALSEGAVRSGVRKALDVGASVEEIEHVILLALTTRGFPATIAAWGWVREVAEQRARH